MNRLIKAVELWSIERGLDKASPHMQALKFFEEAGELVSALIRKQEHELVDAIGDVLVTLIILARQVGLDIEKSLAVAYDEIKDRKGEMKNGTFIKEEDL